MNISVIIPTFNRAEFVCEAVQSVLKQTEPVDEIIVVDDGSTDDTLDRLKKFGSKIQIISQENKGVSAARNAGIKKVQHEWLAFLDSDDLWKPKKIAKQKQALLENLDYQICYTNEEWRRNGEWLNQKKIHQKYSGHIYEKCLPLCIISPSSVTIHTSLFEKIGLFDEQLPACEDYDLWLRICAEHPVLFLDERLITKRAGDWEQLSKDHSLDKYRIIALTKALQSGRLTKEHKSATLNMLEQKCAVYRLGCEKHDKKTELEFITKIEHDFLI